MRSKVTFSGRESVFKKQFRTSDSVRGRDSAEVRISSERTTIPPLSAVALSPSQKERFKEIGICFFSDRRRAFTAMSVVMKTLSPFKSLCDEDK